MKSFNVSTILGAAAITAMSLLPVYGAQRGESPSKPHTPSGAPKSTTKPKSFADRMADHPQLAKRLEALCSCNDLNVAEAGFKNEGQFIAALHVSKNLDIPFDQLKTEMTGKDKLSLGQAIKKLRPTADADDAAKRGEREAADDQKDAK